MTKLFSPLKIAFYLTAIIIIVGSTLFSNRLAKELAEEEQKKIELWAEAVRLLAQDNDTNQDYSLSLKIIEGNTNIPVILTDKEGNILSHANLNLSKKHQEKSLAKKKDALINKNQCIEIKLSRKVSQYLYYDDSNHLKQLRYFPYIQLGVMFIFLAITILAYSISQKSEQNRIWVGLSKETAHQLGTPISSLMAWVELLKIKNIDAETIQELEKDTLRLKTIADRFSKIGSKPQAERCNLVPVIENAAQYIRNRCSQKISINTHFGQADCYGDINVPLFEWVVENLCKNAVDAMGSEGRIDIFLKEDDKQIFIDVQDTGKGISKNHFKEVFKPGFTNKKRGWGLGLSLAKRIVEEYHRGKIFVKQSELDKGTTFRIILYKAL